jgi:hypothetical protein
MLEYHDLDATWRGAGLQLYSRFGRSRSVPGTARETSMSTLWRRPRLFVSLYICILLFVSLSRIAFLNKFITCSLHIGQISKAYADCCIPTRVVVRYALLHLCNFQFPTVGNNRNHNSSVGIGMNYGLGNPGSIPGRGKIFLSLHNVKIGSEAHPASCPVCTSDAFPGDKTAGAWRWSVSSI